MSFLFKNYWSYLLDIWFGEMHAMLENCYVYELDILWVLDLDMEND